MNCSNIETGRIVVARVTLDRQEYAVVAVCPEAAEGRIVAGRTMQHYADRLFAGLPVVLAFEEMPGQWRFVGGLAAERLQESPPPLEWKTLYEDGLSEAAPAA